MTTPSPAPVARTGMSDSEVYACLERQHQLDRAEINLLRAEVARLADGQMKRRARHLYFGSLTWRELDVLKLLALGYSDPQIASKRHLSPRTVRVTNVSIYRKLGVKDRVNAALYAWRNGIVSIEEAWEVVMTLQWTRLPTRIEYAKETQA